MVCDALDGIRKLGVEGLVMKQKTVRTFKRIAKQLSLNDQLK